MLQGYTIELSDVIGFFSVPCLYYHVTSSQFLHFWEKAKRFQRGAKWLIKRSQMAHKEEPDGIRKSRIRIVNDLLKDHDFS